MERPSRPMQTLPSIPAPYALTETRHGLMLVNRNDLYMGQALLHYGECFELELQFMLSLLRKPGMVLDVGANMGIHTVPLARALAARGGTVVALEPQPIVFQQLCANLALNALMNVIALPYACGNENGPLIFDTPDYLRPGNFGGTEMRPADAAQTHQQVVQCARLDDLLPNEDIDFIKIDVEGFELEVLRGSSHLLERCKPILYVENDRVERSPQLIQWLLDHDYRMWWHFPPLYNPANFRGFEKNIYADLASTNMFCIPASLSIQVENFVEVTDPDFHPLAPGASLTEMLRQQQQAAGNT